jgi:hypothetical protein
VNFSPDVKEQALYYQDINLLFSDNEIERMTHPRIDKAVSRELIKSLVLLPKVSWIVPGSLIYEYLDIPEGVEFEDIWFSLIAYSGPLRITKVDAVWYLYRQHNHQVFGSLAKGGDEVVAFRYGRILRSLDAIIRHKPDLAHLLEQPASRYRTLASMSITKILYFLGPKEALLHILKIHTPGLLKTLKKYIRESG